MVVFSKNVFSSLIMFFSEKSEVGKIRKYEETKQTNFEKICFHLLKRHLHQNGKTENMPVVAGRLGTNFLPNAFGKGSKRNMIRIF